MPEELLQSLCLCNSSTFCLLPEHVKHLTLQLLSCTFNIFLTMSLFSAGITFQGQLQLVAFCVFEFAVGLFWPSMMKMRSQHVPEEMRATVINLFRVPLNLFVCIVLYNVRSFILKLLINCKPHHGWRLGTSLRKYSMSSAKPDLERQSFDIRRLDSTGNRAKVFQLTVWLRPRKILPYGVANCQHMQICQAKARS